MSLEHLLSARHFLDIISLNCTKPYKINIINPISQIRKLDSQGSQVFWPRFLSWKVKEPSDKHKSY